MTYCSYYALLRTAACPFLLLCLYASTPLHLYSLESQSLPEQLLSPFRLSRVRTAVYAENGMHEQGSLSIYRLYCLRRSHLLFQTLKMLHCLRASDRSQSSVHHSMELCRSAFFYLWFYDFYWTLSLWPLTLALRLYGNLWLYTVPVGALSLWRYGSILSLYREGLGNDRPPLLPHYSIPRLAHPDHLSA